MERGDIDVVLFDLGGVLVDFGGVAPMRGLANIASDEELWERWLTCPWVRTFERGQCSAEAFSEGIVSDWGLDVSPDSFLAAFESWPGATLPGAEQLVHEVRTRTPVGYLSNTNTLHREAHSSRWPVLTAFDHRFLSFEMGMVKPDPELFEAVATSLALPAVRLLFMDDNVRNVRAASAAGFRAEHAQGVQAARAALVAHGVLDD
ncbi:MAG TPA: HAD family phosphatase [Acidimicrobiales bacterium]|nr:HAD family phosphatase [Acidimicrobiales bacterium]